MTEVLGYSGFVGEHTLGPEDHINARILQTKVAGILLLLELRNRI